MRTTVDIPDPIYRKLKAKAAEEGCSIKALVLRGVESVLNGAEPKKGKRVKLPLLESKHPYTLNLTNEQLYDLIDFP